MVFVRIFVLRSHDERSNRYTVTISFAFSHGLGRKQTLPSGQVKTYRNAFFDWGSEPFKALWQELSSPQSPHAPHSLSLVSFQGEVRRKRANAPTAALAMTNATTVMSSPER